MWRPKGHYTPVPGDAFVMLHKSDAGELNGRGHIGFVYRVSQNGKRFNTIEGNCGDRVKLGERGVDDRSMAGFIDFWKDGRSLQKTFQRGLVAANSSVGLSTR